MTEGKNHKWGQEGPKGEGRKTSGGGGKMEERGEKI